MVLVSVIHAMSPTPYTSGWPGTVRSGPTAMRFPCCSSSPRPETSGLACRPAPQISVWAFSIVPDFSRTRVGSMLSTTSPSMISTVRFSSAFAAYVCNPS